MTYLAYGPRIKSVGFAGCCGASIIHRAGAHYTTKVAYNAARKDWEKRAERDQWIFFEKRLKGTSLATICSNLTAFQIMRELSYWPGEGKLETRVAFPGAAVPPEKMFAIMLSEVGQRSLIFLADNIEGMGDHHQGPCSTRELVKWIRANELGGIVSSSPVRSVSTRRQIQGWIFTPNWEAINNEIATVKTELITTVKELNSVPKVKERYEERAKRYSAEKAALTAKLAAGW